MTNRFRSTRLLVASLLVCLTLRGGFGALAQEPAPDPEAQPAAPVAPKRADRVYLHDLEGIWIARDYLERLRNSRAPHATARRATGIAIKIERAGRTYPIVITDFQKAIRNFIIDVQPDVKPKSYRLVLAKQDRPGISSTEVSYLYFRGERNADGVFQALSMAEPNFARKRYLTYLRLTEPLETFVDRAVIAGTYVDAEGGAYAFTEQGEAILPDRSFLYEISLDPTRADCELIFSHREREPKGKERIGFSWDGAQLRLFEVNGKKPPYKCKSKPFAVLTRQ